MTRRVVFFLALLALMLTLVACQPKYEVPETTDPTLPSIPLDQTPMQQLAAAIAKTEKETCYDIQYGIKTLLGTDQNEDVHSQAVSENRPLGLDKLYEKVPELEVRQDFLEKFGNCSLRIIPSNTGVIRYEVLLLSWEAAEDLLYGDHREPPSAGADWTISLTVDASGRLSRFEITSAREGETRTAFFSITFPEDP